MQLFLLLRNAGQACVSYPNWWSRYNGWTVSDVVFGFNYYFKLGNPSVYLSVVSTFNIFPIFGLCDILKVPYSLKTIYFPYHAKQINKWSVTAFFSSKAYFVQKYKKNNNMSSVEGYVMTCTLVLHSGTWWGTILLTPHTHVNIVHLTLIINSEAY